MKRSFLKSTFIVLMVSFCAGTAWAVSCPNGTSFTADKITFSTCQMDFEENTSLCKQLADKIGCTEKGLEDAVKEGSVLIEKIDIVTYRLTIGKDKPFEDLPQGSMVIVTIEEVI